MPRHVRDAIGPRAQFRLLPTSQNVSVLYVDVLVACVFCMIHMYAAYKFISLSFYFFLFSFKLSLMVVLLVLLLLLLRLLLHTTYYILWLLHQFICTVCIVYILYMQTLKGISLWFPSPYINPHKYSTSEQNFLHNLCDKLISFIYNNILCVHICMVYVF